MSRHSGDLVVPECKDGPTWGGSHLRLDYWVLRRSWTKPAMIGYEVKASRRDWLADQKWQNYLPLCNELWFIAARDHILAGELPEGVGHLRPAGSRLITVKRAAWREIEPPATLMTYVLMCRSKIEREHRTDTDATARWSAWLAEREEKRRIGYEVGKALRERYERDVEQVRRENEALKARAEKLAAIQAALEARGVSWNSWTTADTIVEDLIAPKWTRHNLEQARAALDKLLNGGGE